MKTLFCLAALLSIFSLIAHRAGAQSSVPEGTELLTNPTFSNGAQGWSLRQAAPIPQIKHAGSDSVRLAGVPPGPQSWSHASVSISPVPIDRELRFSCYVKGQGAGQTITINEFGYDQNSQLTADASASVTLPDAGWKYVSTSFAVPPGTVHMTLWIINSTARSVLVSDAHLNVGRAKKAAIKSLNGPGVIRAMAQAAVRPVHPGEAGTVTFPIPGTYREQVPLAFKVQAQPASALKGYRWRQRADKTNWTCEVTVAPPSAGVIVRWEALVLVRTREDKPLPLAKQPDAPTEVARWTHSTACVQSDDPAIQAKAKELAKGAPDIETYVKRVIQFTSTNEGKGAVFNSLDARKALDCGGSCTSRANLAAALLRAHGIPARTLAHLPAWSPPLYEHWLIEYWHPGVGWVWAESTLDQFRPQPWTLAVLNVANPEDEERAFDPIHLRYVMPGAAYLSVAELSKELLDAGLFKDDATNQAVPEARIEGTEEEMNTLFDGARRAFTALSKQGEAGEIDPAVWGKIETALQSGKATNLTAALN